MRSSLLRLVLAASTAGILLFTTAAADQQRDTRRHTVYAAVVGQNDAPIRDLKLEDFIVREDGRAREILEVGPAPPASHIAFLVDDSAASTSAMPHLRVALLDMSRYLLALTPPPQIALYTFGERPTRRSEFSSNATSVQNGIGKLFPISTAGAVLLEAIVELSTDLSRRKAERPFIFVFLADDGPEFSNTSRKEVTTALQQANATLWTIVLQKGPPNLNSREWQERAQVVTDVATESGGMSKFVVSDLSIGPAFTAAASLLNSQYRITYARPDTLIPPSKLAVEVRRPNTRVAATRWIRP